VISFQPTEEQEVVREAMHDFAKSALRAAARECDEASKIPDALLAQAAELGLVSTQIPEEFGGGGEARSPITNAIVAEELAWGDATLAVAALAPAAFAFAVADQGTEAQKRELLPALCSDAPASAAIAFVEPTATFDALLPRTQAEPKGQGFVLSGVKSFVPLGDRASHFLVIARNNGGLDAFVVPRGAEGLRISQPEKNLGLRALPCATLTLERVELPGSARLGGAAGCDVRRLLAHSRAVLEYAVPYAKDRVAFDQAIAQKQAIAFRLADMHIETEATRWLTWAAAADLERGRDATRSAHQARAYAAEKCMWIADQGVQVLGGHGFIREHPVEMWYRNARTLGVLEGTVAL